MMYKTKGYISFGSLKCRYLEGSSYILWKRNNYYDSKMHIDEFLRNMKRVGYEQAVYICLNENECMGLNHEN